MADRPPAAPAPVPAAVMLAWHQLKGGRVTHEDLMRVLTRVWERGHFQGTQVTATVMDTRRPIPAPD